ncbi:MAG: hypothetical protein ACLVB5_02160 [Christensenellales bacterium]
MNSLRPFGFEVIDIRLSAQIGRLETARGAHRRVRAGAARRHSRTDGRKAPLFEAGGRHAGEPEHLERLRIAHKRQLEFLRMR